MTQPYRSVGVGLLVFVVMCFLASVNSPAQAASASTLLIGAPGDSGGNCIPFGCTSSGQIYQQVYGAQSFSGVTEISAITFLRTTTASSGSNTISTATYTLKLSTTSKPVNGLDLTNFDDNTGPDAQMFFSGVLTGNPGGPLTITGSPFIYDPARGNLLLDIRVSGTNIPFGGIFFDARNGTAQGLFSRASTGLGVAFSSDYGLVTQFTVGGGSTTIGFTDRAAFAAATTGLSTISFGGILPPGVRFGDYSPLDVPGASFSTPLPGTFVNITRSDFYAPNNYPADFIVDSVNQNTGLPNANNELVIALTNPTFAVGLDVGGLGFSGASNGTLTLSNGHVFNIPSLPTVGHTLFVGFVSTVPITALTFTTTNDSWVVEDVIIARPVISSCTFAFAPSGQSFGPQGGLGSFNLNTGTGCKWTLSFSDGWITPVSPFASPGGGPPSGAGPRTVTFSVGTNSGPTRTGTISVGGQNFNVDQKEGSPTPVCTFSVNPSHATLEDLGGNIRVVVTAPIGCPWNAVSNAGWLRVTSGASGNATSTVVILADSNTGTPRTGTVTIAGQAFTVSQGGGACGAIDVTDETRVQKAGLSYIPFTTYFYSGTITVINSSTVTLHPPLFVVLVGLPNHLAYPAGDGVIGAAQTTCFTTAGDAMYLLPTGDLAPGHSTQVSPLFFTQSLFGGISYQPKVLSGTPTR